MKLLLFWLKGYEINSNRLVCVHDFFFICSVLASWFRLKYPHVALGALASSAPILYFDDITPQNGYFSVVSKDFKVTDWIFLVSSMGKLHKKGLKFIIYFRLVLGS